MRTVGEILKKARLENNLTLEEVERIIKIRKKYLEALEGNNWGKLPSLPYIKGFIRSYSSFLGLKPEEMIAIFRREFSGQDKTGLLPKGLSKPLNEPAIRITSQTVIIGAVVSFLLVFFGYLAFQYKAYISPPDLTITKPLEGETVATEKVQVTGITDNDAVISINNQKIAVAGSGEFSTTLELTPGINTIQIESVSKYGKKRTITRTIQVQGNP
jgi:cytoskeletal protein RodZ